MKMGFQIVDPEDPFTVEDVNGKLISGPCKIEEYDLKSLNEIDRLVNNDSYKDKKTLFEHMNFLEQLSDKLKEYISFNERSGENAWTLHKDLNRVKSLYERLSKLTDKF